MGELKPTPALGQAIDGRNESFETSSTVRNARVDVRSNSVLRQFLRARHDYMRQCGTSGRDVPTTPTVSERCTGRRQFVASSSAGLHLPRRVCPSFAHQTASPGLCVTDATDEVDVATWCDVTEWSQLIVEIRLIIPRSKVRSLPRPPILPARTSIGKVPSDRQKARWSPSGHRLITGDTAAGRRARARSRPGCASSARCARSRGRRPR